MNLLQELKNWTQAIPVLLLTLLLLTSASSCQGEMPPPEGWVTHSFKLTEHPEAFTGERDVLNGLITYKTLADDTRKGFMMTNLGNLEFDVFLPPKGTIKFAYGFDNDLATYSKEVGLKLNAIVNGSALELGKWEIATVIQDESRQWTDVTVPIPQNVSGPKQLEFSIDGFTRTPPADSFIIAHPTIVAPNKGADRKRVILISIDTLRADHLGCYGYERPTSQRLDEFADDATLFERCISICPWTFPAYASMFTGRYPSISGATTNMLFLPESELLLQEIISAKDFATFSVHAVSWVGRGGGMHRGFDTSNLILREYADVSFKLAQEWLTEHFDEDSLMFIHLYDPHLPFKPKDEHFGKFDPDYKGRFKRQIGNAIDIREGKVVLNNREKKHIEALYDEVILGCDEDISAFLDFLKTNGFYKDSLIIVNSDHGEEFWEHGGFTHGHQLYDEVLHVPLIIRGSGFKGGKRIEGMCSNFDVYPTILQWLGLDVPDDINATSLFNLMNGEVEASSRLILSEQLVFGVEQKGISTDEYRYIFHTIDGSEELYFVHDDPGMSENLAADRRATVRDFRYFITEYTLNEGTGWHVYLFRNDRFEGGEKYNGKIVAPSGFAEVNPMKLTEKDDLIQDGNELHFSISLPKGEGKGFDFKTNDEADEVYFEIITDGDPEGEQLVFLGPDKLRVGSTSFTMTILDPMFGLGMVQIAPKGGDLHGAFIWGNSESLREEVAAGIDDRTLEELKSLGYLH